MKTSLKLDAAGLLPPNQAYQTYSGSLTTPPCSEKVTWVVINRTAEASAAQIKTFRDNMLKVAGYENYRMVQPLNGRQVIFIP